MAGQITRTPDQILHDRREIARLRRRGWSVPDIAEKLKLTEMQVRKDLRRLREEWKKRAAVDVQAERQAMLDQLDDIMREAWAAWERSQEAKETTTEERTGLVETKDGTPALTKRTHRIEGQVGHPRFLEIIERCLERRAKLLGLDAPQKFVGMDEDGNEIELSEEEKIARIAAIMERARARRLAAAGKLGATAADPDDDSAPTVH